MRPAMSKTLTCPVCGVTFTKTVRNQVYCSRKCAHNGSRTLQRTRERKRRALLRDSLADDAMSATKPVTFEVLSKAKTKPANTSAVRWRMELRRRALAKRLGLKNLTLLPDPDII